jgi:chromosomal replication initiation ATPase DnaA
MTKIFARDIIKEEVKRYRISLDYLRGDTRTNHLVNIRHYIIWRVRTETGMSFPELGKLLNRDHTSVLHAYKKA